jgi:hypothetical protein
LLRFIVQLGGGFYEHRLPPAVAKAASNTFQSASMATFGCPVSRIGIHFRSAGMDAGLSWVLRIFFEAVQPGLPAIAKISRSK